jgi:hypothetical protein
MRLALLASLAVLAAACAAYSGSNLRPGAATESDVRATMGTPAMALDNSDGTRELIYPKGPMGNETYIARIAPGGKLASIDQVLNDAHFDSMPNGLTEQEVLRRLGPPRDTMAFGLSRTHAWDWKYMDLWGYESIFSVTFNEQGVSVSKFKQRIERGGENRK